MNASTHPSEASPLLDVQRDARGVVRLTLNDPQRFNALGEQMLTQLQQALDRSSQPLQRYRCAACGFEANQHFWQCPGCQTWDSYPARRVEEL